MIPRPATLLTGLVALAALALAAAAPFAQGDPIQNRVVVGVCCVKIGDDEYDEEGTWGISGTTDRSGGVVLSGPPGRYALKLPNAETLRVPAAARIEVGRAVLTTSTIQPGGRGDVYFQNREGRRLIFTVPRGARVRVVLTEGAPAAGGSRQRRTGELKTNIPDPEPRLCFRGPVGDVDGDGRFDARTDPRIPPPAPRASSQR